ncbi:hypothetical protein L3Y34_010409 [Caenorhabditis briggsae]|uniref:Uncharacterized protein n=1 Tax=Caenorhabditis briggsae TaxID=6238 RepID=A0AAE9CSL7_CAEBR|nr:hypothetical protein L3Y34_010409 [Caenorhabditis briggsae]
MRIYVLLSVSLRCEIEFSGLLASGKLFCVFFMQMHSTVLKRYLPSIGFSLGRLHVLSIKLDGQLLMAFGLESSFNERLRVTNEELRRTDTLQLEIPRHASASSLLCGTQSNPVVMRNRVL